MSQGSAETGTTWAIGEGMEGGASVDSTFVLVSNASADAGQVRLTVVYDDATSEQREYALSGNARLTVRVGDDFAHAAGRRFSILVESLGSGETAGVPVTVECARYQSAGSVFAQGGGVALATRIQRR